MDTDPPANDLALPHFPALAFVSVIAFGALGVLVRYAVTILFLRVFRIWSAYVTLCVNMLGSFVIGILQVTASERKLLDVEWKYGLMTGLMGGLTTWSSYTLDTLLLFEMRTTGAWVFAFLNLFVAPAFGVLLSFSTVRLFRLIFAG